MSNRQYGRPTSIGDASALFGGGAGGDDFFGGSASKAPGFGAVQEEEEPAEQQQHYQQHQQQQYGGYEGQYQQQGGYDGYSSQGQQYGGGQQYGQQDQSYGGWQGQQQPQQQGYGSQNGQGQQYGYGGGEGGQYQPQQYQQPQGYQQPQQSYQPPQQQSYGGYQSPGVFSSGPVAPQAYDPYAPTQQAPVQQPYSPPPTSSYHSPPARTSSIPPGSQGSAAPATTRAAPPPAQRVQTYDAYDPPPMRRKSSHALNRSMGVTTPPLPVGSPLSFGQALHGSQTGRASPMGSSVGSPPPPPKRKGPTSRPGSTQPHPPASHPEQYSQQQGYGPNQYAGNTYDYRDQNRSPPAQSQYDPYGHPQHQQYQQPPQQQQYYAQQSLPTSPPPPSHQHPQNQWQQSQQPAQNYDQSSQYQSYDQTASDPYAQYAAETGQNYDDYEQMAEAFAQGHGQGQEPEQAQGGYDGSYGQSQQEPYQGYGGESYEGGYGEHNAQGYRQGGDVEDVEGGGWNPPAQEEQPAPEPTEAPAPPQQSQAPQQTVEEDFFSSQPAPPPPPPSAPKAAPAPAPPKADAPGPVPPRSVAPPPAQKAAPPPPKPSPPAPALTSVLNGETVADFQRSVGAAPPPVANKGAGPDRGLAEAAQDPSILKTFGQPQSSQPEPDLGQGESSTLDPSQRLRTPPPPPPVKRSTSPSAANGVGSRVGLQLSPPRLKDSRPAKASPLRSIVPLATSPTDEVPPAAKPDPLRSAPSSGLENHPAPVEPAPVAPPAPAPAKPVPAEPEPEPKVEGEEEEDAWGFEAEEDEAGLAGGEKPAPTPAVAAPKPTPVVPTPKPAPAQQPKATPVIPETKPKSVVPVPEAKPYQPLAALPTVARLSEPLAAADDIDDAWGLEDDEVVGLEEEEAPEPAPAEPEPAEPVSAEPLAPEPVPPAPTWAPEPSWQPEPEPAPELLREPSPEPQPVSEPEPEPEPVLPPPPRGAPTEQQAFAPPPRAQRVPEPTYEPEPEPEPTVEAEPAPAPPSPPPVARKAHGNRVPSFGTQQTAPAPPPPREATPPLPIAHEPEQALAVPSLNVLPATPEPVRRADDEIARQEVDPEASVPEPADEAQSQPAASASFDILADLGQSGDGTEGEAAESQDPYAYEGQQYDPNSYGGSYGDGAYGAQSYGGQQYGEYGYGAEEAPAQDAQDPYAPQSYGALDAQQDAEAYGAEIGGQQYGDDAYPQSSTQQDYQYESGYGQQSYGYTDYGAQQDAPATDGQYGGSYEPYSAQSETADYTVGQQSYDNAYAPAAVNGIGSDDAYQHTAERQDSYGGFGAAAALGGASAEAATSYGAEFDDAYAPAKGAALDGQGPDPLERQRANLAIVSFGFGGKLLTTFPAAQDGYGGAVGVLTAPPITIRKLKDVTPAAALEAYPGPLFMDGGSKASAGKKRKDIVGWLDGRIDEAEKRCSYLQGVHQMAGLNGAATKSEESVKAVERTILLKLVKVLLENEGKLSGKRAEEAVRSILAVNSAASNLSTTSVTLPTADQFHASMLDGSGGSNDSSPTVATYTVRTSSLDKLEELLAHGQREAALDFAISKQMWTHALVIANTLGASNYNETVQAFVRAELGGVPGTGVKGRASLRALYGLFAGGGGAALEQFLPPRQLSPAPFAPPRPPSTAPALLTPTGPRSRAPTPAPQALPDYRSVGQVSDDVLQDWRTAVAMVVANSVSGDSQFLTAIGDTLLANGRVDAAHACYLLSSANIIGGSDNPMSRIALIGSVNGSDEHLDHEAVMLTEVVEFALSLITVQKGQEAFPGLPHLQGYKLALAHDYAGCGLTSTAQRYCDAIAATLKLATKSSPYYHPAFLLQVRSLSDRLTAAPAQDKGASWISRKMQRPTFDTVLSTLEGRFSKFVAGENDPPVTPTNPRHDSGQGATLGPFSHYSAISPAGSTAGSLSRQQSSSDLLAAARAQAPHPLPAATPPPAPAPLPSKAPPPTSWKKGHHQRSSSLGTHGYQYDPHHAPSWGTSYSGGTLATAIEASPDPGRGDFEPEAAQADSGAWWGSGEGGEGGSAARPPTFQSFGTDPGQDTEGFIDPMAAYTPQNASPALGDGPDQYRPTTLDEVDEEDDLGLGNSKSKGPAADGSGRGDGQSDSAPQDAKPDPKAREPSPAKKPDAPQLKSMPSSSWIGRWFKRDAAAGGVPGPIRANLGEEVSLVYDPETKRWVSKKAGGAAPAAAHTPPPPPSRAQTASPTTALRGRSASTSPAPPPPRSMGSSPALGSKPDFSHLPPPPPLPKSLSSSPAPSATPPPPSGGPATPPIGPPTGPRKSGAKKPIRSRYVEIK